MTTLIIELLAIVVVLSMLGPKLEHAIVRLEQRFGLPRGSRRPARPINRVAPRPATDFARAAGLSHPRPAVLTPPRPRRYLAAGPHRDPSGKMTVSYTYATLDGLLADCGYPAEELRGSQA